MQWDDFPKEKLGQSNNVLRDGFLKRRISLPNNSSTPDQCGKCFRSLLAPFKNLINSQNKDYYKVRYTSYNKLIITIVQHCFLHSKYC